MSPGYRTTRTLRGQREIPTRDANVNIVEREGIDHSNAQNSERVRITRSSTIHTNQPTVTISLANENIETMSIPTQSGSLQGTLFYL